MNQEKLKKAKNYLFIALGIDMVIIALVIISDLWVVGIFNSVDYGGGQLDQPTISPIDFWVFSSWSIILTATGVGITLVRWLGQCYKYAKETLKATGFEQEVWKSWGWIIPVIFLYKPYQVLSEIYKAGSTDYVGGDKWKKISGSGWLLSWWIFWVSSHWLMFFFGLVERSLARSIPYTLSLSRAIDIYNINLIIAVVSLIVASLWFVVANRLSERLLNRPDRTVFKNTRVNAASYNDIDFSNNTRQSSD